METVNRRMIEVLWAFYQHREDGTPETVAMALGRDADGPVFRSDVDKLYEVGAIELVDGHARVRKRRPT
jgi:hypothetical protein